MATPFGPGRRIETWIDDARRDVRHALRTLARSPGFAAVAIATLALGIGATSAIVSVAHAVLVRPLPYKDSERLVRLVAYLPGSETPPQAPRRTTVALSAAEIAELGARTRMLSHLGTAGTELLGLSGLEEAARLQGAQVSASLLDLLDVQPLVGRRFLPADEDAGAPGVVLVSHRVWHRHFGAEPALIGREVTFDSVLGPRRQERYTVIGVMPPQFAFPSAGTDFWMPVRARRAPAGAVFRGPLMARLADGVTPAMAATEVGEIVRTLRQHPPGTRYEFVTERTELVAEVRPALRALVGGAALVLLIACANVAGLLLARSTARRAEMAVRRAIGAAPGRLVRQALVESWLLAAIGGAAGIGVAIAGLVLLRTLATTVPRIDLGIRLLFPRLDEIRVDLFVLALTVAITAVAGTLAGVAPALRAARTDPMDALRRGGSRGVVNEGGRRFGARGLLIAGQIALAVVLLVAGGLLVNSFLRLSSIHPGYDAARVLTFQVSLPVSRYPDASLRQFADDLVRRMRAIPGVESAAYANQLPMVQLRDTVRIWRTPDPARPRSAGGADIRFVSPDYFRVMRIPIVAGRSFDDAAHAATPRAMIVNRTLARTEFPGEDPVGRHVYFGRETTPWEIVGIADDVRQFALQSEPGPQAFLDLRQRGGDAPTPLFPIGAYYAVRTTGDPRAIVPLVRKAVRDMDAGAALFNVMPMDALVRTTISRPRMYMVLLGVFAATGLLLAAIGVYGLVSFAVAQRTREVGIRMALGARAADVMRLVLVDAGVLAVVGTIAGIAAAVLASRFLESLLFGVRPIDPTTIVVVLAVLGAAMALAAIVPARRAVRVDPMISLRAE